MNYNSPPLVSIIMPMYNAETTLTNAVRSALDTYRKQDVELILVDDCSTDNTLIIAKNLQRTFANVSVLSMPSNTGSPSAPRNLGIEHATGEYLAFLDDDDTIAIDTLLSMLDDAKANSTDFLSGYLSVVNNNGSVIANRLNKLPASSDEARRIFVTNFSLGITIVLRRTIVIEHHIRFDPSISIGEDLLFCIQGLIHSKHIQYIDRCFYYYNRQNIEPNNPSSMQVCGDREIIHRISALKQTYDLLKTVGLDYYALRVHVPVRDMLLSIVRYSEGISQEAFDILSQFVIIVHPFIKDKVYINDRYDDIYQAIRAHNYQAYLVVAKRRLLITGYDLKFILPAIPYLEAYYDIRLDEWTAHDAHDKKQSEALLQWSDIIWCEWLLENAVYYSQRITPNQRLVIRTHRFEVTRDFGKRVNYNNVSMVFAVAYHYFVQFRKTFTIPPQKMRLFAHYVDEHLYTTDKSEDARFNIGMVGILPTLKGYKRALEILKLLHEQDNRFKLRIVGKLPQDLSWVRTDKNEMAYYQACQDYIDTHNLQDAVVFEGFKAQPEIYRNLGYVLSLSDTEAFHTAVAEGACAGSACLLLNSWAGVEQVYPAEFIYSSIEKIANQILTLSKDDALYKQQVDKLNQFVITHYGMDRFVTQTNNFLKKVWM